MAITPRCELSAAVNATAVSPALTGWTNAGAGVSGTAPANGDFVVLVMTSNTASDTCNQTGGTKWTPLDGGGTNLGASVGCTTIVFFKIWEGNETAPTFTWASNRNSYTVMALAPDAGSQIYSDVWSGTKKDTTAATTHTPNSVTIPAGFTDCVLTLTGALASVTGSTSALTWTASTSYTIPAGASASNAGTTAQFVYGTSIQYRTGLTGLQAPAAMTIAQGATTTFAQLYTVAIRQIPLTTAPFDVLQTLWVPNGTSGTLPAPTSAGPSALVVIASLANTVATAAPSVSAMTLGGSADHFAAAKEVSVLGTTFSLANSYYAGIWVDPDCASGQTAFAATVANNAAGASTGFIVMEVAGLAPSLASGLVDKTVSATGSSGAANSGTTATTATAVQFLVGAIGGGSGNNAIAGPGPAGNIGLVLSANMEGGAYSVITAAATAAFSATLKSTYCWAAAAVTLLSGTAAHPAALATTTAFSAPTVRAGSGVTPAVLATSASFPAVTVNAGSRVTPAALATSASFPAVQAGPPAPDLGVSATSSGTTNPKVFAVTANTLAGDSLIVAITVNQVTYSITSVTDSQGNVYTLDASQTAVTPQFYCYRAPGATGGPSGAPTVPLTTSDTITITGSTVSSVVDIQLIDVPAAAGGLDKISAMAVAASGTTASASATPAQNGELCIAAFGINQNAVSVTGAVAPAVLLGTVGPGPFGSSEYLQAGAGTAGVSQTASLTLNTSAPWRAMMWTFTPNATAAPALLATPASFPAVSIRADQIRSQPALATPVSFPAVTVTAGASATVTPTSLAVSASFGAPSIRADQTAAPSSLAASATFPAPAVSTGSVVTTTALPVSASFPAAAVSAGSVVTTTVLATAACFPAATVNVGTSVTVTPSVLAVSASFGAPAVSAGTSVTPAPLAVSASFPVRTIRADQAVTPASLAVSASFPAPVVGQGQVAVPAALSVSVSFPAVPSARARWSPPPPWPRAPASRHREPDAPVPRSPRAPWPSAPAFPLPRSVPTRSHPRSLAAPGGLPAAYRQPGPGRAPASLAASVSFAGLRSGPTRRHSGVPGGRHVVRRPGIRADQSVTPAVLAIGISFPAPRRMPAPRSPPPPWLPPPASRPRRSIRSGPRRWRRSASFAAPRVNPVIPSLLAVSASFPAPAIQAGSAVPVTTLALAAIFTPPVVQTGTSAVITPSLLAASTSFSTPAIRADQKLTALPLAVSASFSASQVRADQKLIPVTLAASTAFPAAAPSGSTSVTPATLACAASFGAVRVNPVIPATLACSISFPAARVDPVGPATLVTSAAFPAPSVSVGSGTVVTPAVLAVAAGFAAPSVVAGSGATVTPGTLAASVAFPARVVRADQVRSQPALNTSVSFGALSVRCGATVTPARLACGTAFPAPVVKAGGNVTVIPATLAVAASFPAPVPRAGSSAAPASLHGTVTFPAPQIAVNATVVPARLSASASFPAPQPRSGSVHRFTTAFHTSVAFLAIRIRADARVTPPVLRTTAGFTAVTPRAGATVTPARLAGLAVFPARQPNAGAVVHLPPLALAVVFPPSQHVISSAVIPSALRTAAAFPPVRIVLYPVHLEVLWAAYDRAAQEAGDAANFWVECKIAGADAGMTATAYARLWHTDGIAQRAWHAWLTATEEEVRKAGQFEVWGTQPQEPVIGGIS